MRTRIEQPASETEGNESQARPRVLHDVLFSAPRTPVLEEGWSALIADMAAGDEAALHALYQRMHGMVLTLALRITRDANAAEQVAVDVFCQVWRTASTYDAEASSVIGWVMSQTRAIALRSIPGQPHEAGTTIAPGELHGTLYNAALQEGFRAALDSLAPQERVAIETLLRSKSDGSSMDAKRRLPDGLDSHLRSGLAKLRNALFDSGSP